jgi:hypothetical protein
MAQAVRAPPGKCEDLRSTPIPPKKLPPYTSGRAVAVQGLNSGPHTW